MIKVNALGDACPIPVVKTKNAMKEMGDSGKIQIEVDNEIAVQNLLKMADQKGYEGSFRKLNEQHYVVELSVHHLDEVKVTSEHVKVKEAENNFHKTTVITIDSDKMGTGIDELGTILLKGFIFALTKQDTFPNKMIFYNGGAKLTCEGSEVLEDLSYLASQGVEILTCGTCLKYHNLEDQLKVGGVSNMYEIAEALFLADKIIKP